MMMQFSLAFLLIFLSSAVSLSEGVLIKKYNQRHDKGGFIFTALVSLFAMVFFVLKDLITDPTGLTFDQALLPYALIAGALYFSASFLTYVALQCGSFALSMLVLSYSLVFSIGYGIFFQHEIPTAFTYIGFALVAASVFLVRGKTEKGKERKVSLKWLICIGLSWIGNGMFGVIMRVQQARFTVVENGNVVSTLDSEFMILSLAISFVVLFAVGLFKDGKDLGYILKNGGLYAMGAGLSNGLTNMMGLIITTMMAISISSPTRAAVKLVLSFLLSYLVYRERFEKRQLVGVALGLIAVVFLNI